MTADLVLDTRTALDLSQAQFAELLGVHEMTVSKWERGLIKVRPWHAGLLNAIYSAHLRDPSTGLRVFVALRSGNSAHALYEALHARFKGPR